MKFGILTILWVTTLVATALSAYQFLSALIAISAAIAYWYIIIDRFEDEHDYRHITVFLMALEQLTFIHS